MKTTARSSGTLISRKPFKVLVCLVTLAAFLFNTISYDVVWAVGMPSALTGRGSDRAGGSGILKELHVDTFTLPGYLGRIKDSYKAGNTNKTIIHIQDAHCNYYAQHKISEIIEYFNKQYGINTVNLEGGAKNYDLSIFTDINDKAIRNKVSDYFVKEGLVNGAEYFTINNPEKTILWGIEDTKLYLDNLNVYRESLKYKDKVDRHLSTLTHILTNLKTRIYSQELLELDTKYSQYKAGTLGFKDYLGYLIQIAKQRAIDTKAFTNIYLLNRTLSQEETVDFKKANKQRDDLIDKLQKNLSKKSLEELVLKTVGLRSERISPKDFYSYLANKSASLGIELKDFPELQKYIAYISTYNAIDKMKTMEEMENLEGKIKETLYQNDEQKALNKLSKNLAMLKNIFNITLTRDDYKYYIDNEQSFDIANYASFIDKEAPLRHITAQLDKNITDLDGYREQISKFYEYSFKRDSVFLKNIKFGKNQKIALVVTGGFHTENLCEKFKKENMSYISIMPAFKDCDGYESPYFRLLTGKKTLLEQKLDTITVFSLAYYGFLNHIINEIPGGQIERIKDCIRVKVQEIQARDRVPVIIIRGTKYGISQNEAFLKAWDSTKEVEIKVADLAAALDATAHTMVATTPVPVAVATGPSPAQAPQKTTLERTHAKEGWSLIKMPLTIGIIGVLSSIVILFFGGILYYFGIPMSPETHVGLSFGIMMPSAIITAYIAYKDKTSLSSDTVHSKLYKIAGLVIPLLCIILVNYIAQSHLLVNQKALVLVDYHDAFSKAAEFFKNNQYLFPQGVEYFYKYTEPPFYPTPLIHYLTRNQIIGQFSMFIFSLCTFLIMKIPILRKLAQENKGFRIYQTVPIFLFYGASLNMVDILRYHGAIDYVHGFALGDIFAYIGTIIGIVAFVISSNEQSRVTTSQELAAPATPQPKNAPNGQFASDQNLISPEIWNGMSQEERQQFIAVELADSKPGSRDYSEIVESVISDAAAKEFMELALKTVYRRRGISTKTIKGIFDILFSSDQKSLGMVAESLKQYLKDSDFKTIYQNYISRKSFKDKLGDLQKFIEGHPLVADIGCGNGDVSEAIAQNVPGVRKVIATDIKKYKENTNPLVEFRLQLYPDKIPIESNTVDTVILRNVLHYVEEGSQEDLIRDINRILKTGGKVIIQEDMYSNTLQAEYKGELLESFLQLNDKGKKAVLSLGNWLRNTVSGGGDIGTHFSYRSMDEWEAIFNKLGFSVINKQFLGIPEDSFTFAPRGFFVLDKLPDGVVNEVKPAAVTEGVSEEKQISAIPATETFADRENIISNRQAQTIEAFNATNRKADTVKVIVGIPVDMNKAEVQPALSAINRGLAKNGFGSREDNKQVITFEIDVNDPSKTAQNQERAIQNAREGLPVDGRIVLFAPQMEKGPQLAGKAQETYKGEGNITVVPDAYSDSAPEKNIFPDVMVRVALGRNIAFYYTGKDPEGTLAIIKDLLAKVADNDLTGVGDLNELLKKLNEIALRIRPIDYKAITDWQKSQEAVATAL